MNIIKDIGDEFTLRLSPSDIITIKNSIDTLIDGNHGIDGDILRICKMVYREDLSLRNITICDYTFRAIEKLLYPNAITQG